MFTITNIFLSAVFFFFNATATTEIYTLSLHDALPIYRRTRCSPSTRRSCRRRSPRWPSRRAGSRTACRWTARPASRSARSEEHTSELQSQFHLVCRLLLEKKKKKKNNIDLRNKLHYKY